MRRLTLVFAILVVAACSENLATNDFSIDLPDDVETDGEGIIARKKPWTQMTKANDDRLFAKDIPWEDGEKVLLLGSDQSFEGCTVIEKYGSHVDYPFKKTLCTVTKSAGLKCTLTPDTPLEEGTYRAIYPVYDYVWYDFIHLSFLYEDWNELDFTHQDIVISDPVTYKEGHALSFVMRHICALVDIDIYPPRTGDYKYLKLCCWATVFPGKSDYWIDRPYDVNEAASGWLNYTTLRCDGNHMQEGEMFQTVTGVLPIDYNNMPMTVHIVYDDGTHYVSDPILMPSLSAGFEYDTEVKVFHQVDEPLCGK